MSKKFGKLKFIPAIALAMVVFMMTAAPAFAAQSQDTTNANGADPFIDNGAVFSTDGTDVQAAITKVLQMPVGTNIPVADFSFTATPVSVNGTAYNNSTTDPNMPPLNDTVMTVSYAGSEDGVPSNNTMAYALETGNILPAGSAFPHAGTYVYTITETSGTYTTSAGETMTYSGGEYTLYVYLVNIVDSNKNPELNTDGTPKLYIKAVGDIVATPDNASQTAGTKIDPTPENLKGALSEMTFTNTYVHTNIFTTPTATNNTLAVSKKVVGDYADTEQYFPYEMTVTSPDVVDNTTGNLTDASTTTTSTTLVAPATTPTPTPVPLSTTPMTYTAYIIGADGNVVTDPTPNTITGATVDTTTGSPTLGLITITSGSPFSFNLKHGETLVFCDTPVGTMYTVNETSSGAEYYPNLMVTYDGTAGAITTNTETEANIALADTDAGIPSTNTYLIGSLVGEGSNSAAYTNTHIDITPMGIIVNNLPFIGMFALAIGALVVFLVLRSRKRKEAYGYDKE